MSKQAKPTHAHISLAQLVGCNYKMPVSYQGGAVIVRHPQDAGRFFRLSAAKFLAGQYQSRGEWVICSWDARAEQITASEAARLTSIPDRAS